MEKPKHHLFVCASFRADGKAQGVCTKKGSMNLLSHLQREIQARILKGVEVSMTGCLNACAKGPVMIDYPAGDWYHSLDEEALDEILDAFEEGRVCEARLVKD